MTDRTNWRLGKRSVNTLVVAVIIRGHVLPLMWTLLPHGGSGSFAIRNALLERILVVLLAKRIAGLLEDREFIGKQWLQFLSKHRAAPGIRLKADTLVGSVPVWALFKGVAAHEVRWWYRPLMVHGVPLRVCAVRDAQGHLRYVATLEHGRHALTTYAQRGSIEVLFKHWRGSGFELESTHLIRPERLNTLLSVVTLVWVWRIGEHEHEQAPIRVLAHARLAVSVVRYGLTTLKAALVNLLWTPTARFVLHVFHRCVQKLSPTEPPGYPGDALNTLYRVFGSSFYTVKKFEWMLCNALRIPSKL